MQLHPNLPSLPIFKSNFSMLLDQAQRCLEYIRFSGDGHISSSVVWAPAALGRVPGSMSVYALPLSAKILSGNSAASQASQLFSSRDGGPTDLATEGEEAARQEGEDQEEGGTGRLLGR